MRLKGTRRLFENPFIYVNKNLTGGKRNKRFV